MASETEHLKVKTELVSVRIYTSEFEIEGHMHTKPGGYKSRVSDVLNVSQIAFIPITEAKYRLRTEPATEFVKADCVITKVENIELLDILGQD